MKKEKMSIMSACDIGQTMMAAKDLILIACDYVAQWGDDCLYDLDTPAFIRAIFSDHGLNAVQKAG